MVVHLTGIYWLMAQVPVWATALILLTLCINILFPGRDKFEGLAYNISYASQIGDASLITCILISATVLQRMQAVPEMVHSSYFQTSIITLSIAWPIAWIYLALFRSRQDTVMDKYHHLVIVPLLAYPFLALLPVTCYYGSSFELISFWLLFSSWVILVIYDGRTGRLQQTKYVCRWIDKCSLAFKLKYYRYHTP
jgi:hypothetical protein